MIGTNRQTAMTHNKDSAFIIFGIYSNLKIEFLLNAVSLVSLFESVKSKKKKKKKTMCPMCYLFSGERINLRDFNKFNRSLIIRRNAHKKLSHLSLSEVGITYE